MGVSKSIVLAPHDDGGGAFAVLCRLARALLRVADENECTLGLYFLNSSVAKDARKRLDDLLAGLGPGHKAIFVPTDNLIYLPKDDKTAAVLCQQIPYVLKKWVRPLCYCWPCEPNWIRPNLSCQEREVWMSTAHIGRSLAIPDAAKKWRDISSGWGAPLRFGSAVVEECRLGD